MFKSQEDNYNKGYDVLYLIINNFWTSSRMGIGLIMKNVNYVDAKVEKVINGKVVYNYDMVTEVNNYNAWVLCKYYSFKVRTFI